VLILQETCAPVTDTPLARARRFGLSAVILTGAHGWPWPDADEAYWMARAAGHEGRIALAEGR
jgi:hypothetical protein